MALRRRHRLPDDLTPEQREQRITELRARRKARARKLAIRSALGTAALVVLVLALGWWLLWTVGGRNFLLAQVKMRLPEGTELAWSKAEGPVSGPMVLHDVRFVSRGCPAVNEQPVEYPDCKFPRTTTFTAKRVVVDPAIRPLFGKRLRLDALEVSDATLDLPDSDEPFELPTWPDVLPQVAPPLALQADTIVVDRLKVTREGAPVIDLRSVRGGLDASEGQVHVERLVVDSDLGRFTAHGDYAPKDNYRTDLAATAVFPRRAGRSLLARTPFRGLPPRLGLVARGDLAKMDVGIAGAVPEPLRASLTLRGAEHPVWTLRANAKGLDPAVLAGEAPSPTPITFDLSADGTGGRAKLRGQFRQGELNAVIQPSQLKLEDKVLAFEPLTLDIFGGRIVVRGSGDFGDRGLDARIRYAVNARGLRLGGTPAPTADEPAPAPQPAVGVDADFGVAGTRAAWTAIGNARIDRDGEHATLRLDGRGNAERMLLRSLDVQMPTGTLQATGEIGWAPATRWKLAATLDGFDPGYFASAWPGRVDAKLATEGRASDGGYDGTAKLTDIGGQLRGRRLGGNADLRLEGARTSGTVLLSVDDGRLEGEGSYTGAPDAQWRLDATLHGFDPGLVLEDWPGAVDGKLATEGRMPVGGAMQATAAITDLGGQLRGRALRGHANLKATGETYEGDVLLGVAKGELQAKGRYTGGAQAAWQADATLRDFDPGLVLEDWPGAVDATLASTGKTRADGGLDITVKADRLGGSLRERALDGHADVDIALPNQGGPRFEGELAVGMGQSRVEAEGRVTDVLAVDANLSPLRLADFLPGASGSVRGSVRLTGARDAPNVDADVTGEGLAYGDYRAQSFTARGRLPWRGSGGDLQLQARGVAAAVAIDTLDLRARGAIENLQLEGDAQGELGRVALSGSALRRGENWSGALDTLELAPARGAGWRLSSPARYAQNGGNWTLSRSCFASSEGGSLCADADWPRRGVHLTGEGVPLALANPYLPKGEDGRAWLINGQIALDAQLRPDGNAWTGSAQLRSAQGGLRSGQRARRDLIGYRGLALDADFNPQRIQATLGAAITGTGSDGDGRIDARVTTGWEATSALSGEVSLNTDELTWLELFSPDIVDPTGSIDGRITLGGTRDAPSLGGQARLSAFRAEVPTLNIVLDQGDVRLDALPDGSARITGAVRSGAGALNVDGSLDWRGGDAPLVLNLKGKDFLASDTRDIHAVIDPDLVVRMQTGQPLSVTGTVAVPEAKLELERLDDGVSASDDVVVLDPVDPEEEPSSPLALDLTLAMGDSVKLAGFGLTGQLGGSLRVRATPGREMMGSGALEIEGRYKAYGQDLRITQGRLQWTNSPVSDPILDVKAEREIGDVIAGIAVKGRASSPEATVYTNQSVSQSDALAYLTLGRPLSGLSGDEQRDVSAASAALTAGGGVLASQLGAKIGLDEAGVMQSRTAGSVFGVGKYLSPKLYVGYGVSLLGTGQVMMLKYLLRKGFDIQIESSSIENRGSINWRKEK